MIFETYAPVVWSSVPAENGAENAGKKALKRAENSRKQP
jgi:hypothetical protein